MGICFPKARTINVEGALQSFLDVDFAGDLPELDALVIRITHQRLVVWANANPTHSELDAVELVRIHVRLLDVDVPADLDLAPCHLVLPFDWINNGVRAAVADGPGVREKYRTPHVEPIEEEAEMFRLLQLNATGSFDFAGAV